jgi:transcriptional regulator with XRE-family HTH domain
MLAAALRDARQAAGLSQEELAARLGVHRMTVLRFEKGHFEPRPKMLAAWAHECGVPLSGLLASIEDRHAHEEVERKGAES